MANLPTSVDATSLTRASETPNADWTGGVNPAGSCAPGVGISTDVPQEGDNPDTWTLLDQEGNARDPQQSQFIGTAKVNVIAQDYEGGDLNDTLSLNDTAGTYTWDRNSVP